MKLVIDPPARWSQAPGGLAVAPGITLRIEPFRPLPFNLEAWRDTTLAQGVDPGGGRLVASVDRQTAGGWPVLLVVTEVGPRRRLHAFYRFVLHGCVASAEGEAHAFDAVMDEIKDVLLAARPDFTTERPLTISDLWAGFDGAPGDESGAADVH